VIESPALDINTRDIIAVDGVALPERERTRLFLYHKPRGLVTSARDLREEPRDHPRADRDHEHAEERDLCEGHRKSERQVIRTTSAGATKHRRKRGQQDERDHDREVLHHHPPDGDLSLR